MNRGDHGLHWPPAAMQLLLLLLGLPSALSGLVTSQQQQQQQQQQHTAAAALHVHRGGGVIGPTVASAAALSSDRVQLTFASASVGSGGLVTCDAAGLELLVSSQLNASWLPAVIVFQSGADRLTLQAPDGAAGCEQTLAAVRFRHACPALRKWDHKSASGPCTPSVANCSVYDSRGRPLQPFEMNLTTTSNVSVPTPSAAQQQRPMHVQAS